MNKKNEIRVEFLSISQNESFARIVVSALAAQLNPTLEQLADIKTAVSEAVTNAIIHGYENQLGFVKIHGIIDDTGIEITVIDEGKGIEDIEKAKQPLYTSKPELERSGMGFTVMETFMDEVIVESKINKGTRVTLKKYLTDTSS